MSICLGWRRGLLFALACTSLFTLTYVLGAPDARTRAADLAHAHVSTLDVAAHIYVASLPRRVDRRRNMTMLANRLGAQFNFVDAVDMHGPAVRNIMNHMRLFRQENPANSSSFAWPESGAQIEPLDWTGPLPAGTHVDESVGVTCNHDDWTPVAPEEAAGWDWMSTGRIACWETHIRILREIASGRGSRWWAPGDEAPIRPADVSLILEDDVDMELDIRKRLAGLWPLLPQTWDMIYFGWCWSSSRESKRTAMGNFTVPGTDQINSLHPSDWPQCTHAYAVSIPGARKLLSHLEYPPFAYSRAIDQAYTHLLDTGRIRAFSIVPAVVTQRKQDKSDIGEGAVWQEQLYNSALESWRDPTRIPCIVLGWCGTWIL